IRPTLTKTRPLHTLTPKLPTYPPTALLPLHNALHHNLLTASRIIKFTLSNPVFLKGLVAKGGGGGSVLLLRGFVMWVFFLVVLVFWTFRFFFGVCSPVV